MRLSPLCDKAPASTHHLLYFTPSWVDQPISAMVEATVSAAVVMRNTANQNMS